MFLSLREIRSIYIRRLSRLTIHSVPARSHGTFENDTIPQEPGGLFTGSALPGSHDQYELSGKQFSIRATSTITPQIVNEAGYSYSYGAVVSDPIGLGAAKNSPDVVSAIALAFPCKFRGCQI